MKFKNSFPVATGLVFILILPGTPTAWAQQDRVWTLAASVMRALEVAPELRAAEAEIAARSSDLSQAGAWPNPTIELRADEKKAIETQNRRGGLRLNQVTITQPIPLRRLDPQRRAAALILQNAQAEQGYQNLQIETLTAQAYHALQRATERQRLAQERLAFAEKMQRSGKPKKGDPLVRYLSPLERARLDVLRETAYQEVAEAEGKWSEAAAQLRALLALAPGEHLETLPFSMSAAGTRWWARMPKPVLMP